jgi:hypothetical protein
MEIFLSICLGLSLSACCGFRVFTPLLITNIASLLGWLHFGSNFQWMGSYYALIIFGTATVLEIIAYYVPWLDHFLDSIAMPMAIAAGCLMSFAVLPADIAPIAKWIVAVIIGGGSAGIVQTGTTTLRAASGLTTGGLGNPVVATGENIAAGFFSFLAIILPIITVIFVMILMYYIFKKLANLRSKKP